MRLQVIIAPIAMLGVFTILMIGCNNTPELITCPGNSEDLVVTRVGRTEYGSFYKLGTVLIRYENRSDANNALTDPVNNFFVKQGYTPKVSGVLFSDWQVVYLDENTDTTPMLKGLNRVVGVEDAELYLVFRASDLILSRLYLEAEIEDDKGETVPKALIEVGKTSDGSLYELGSVLVQYHKDIVPLSDPSMPSGTSSPKKDVHDFFVSKGYKPENKFLHTKLEVVYVGECVDTALMLEDLRSLPTVADAQLNTFSLFITPAAESLLTSSDVSE